MDKSMTELRSVTCHMGSHSATCHPTQVSAPRLNPSHAGRYSIYLPQRDGRLSLPGWLVIDWDGLPVRRESNLRPLGPESNALTTEPPSTSGSWYVQLELNALMYVRNLRLVRWIHRSGCWPVTSWRRQLVLLRVRGWFRGRRQSTRSGRCLTEPKHTLNWMHSDARATQLLSSPASHSRSATAASL